MVIDVKRGVRQPEWSAELHNWIITENRESRIANCESDTFTVKIRDSKLEIRNFSLSLTLFLGKPYSDRSAI